jgi:hypothetical protein
MIFKSIEEWRKYYFPDDIDIPMIQMDLTEREVKIIKQYRGIVEPTASEVKQNE